MIRHLFSAYQDSPKIFQSGIVHPRHVGWRSAIIGDAVVCPHWVLRSGSVIEVSLQTTWMVE